MPSRSLTWTALLLSIFVVGAASAANPFRNLDEIARRIGFDAHASAQGTKTVKIAILDNGFKGYAAEIGHSLPTNTQFHSGPVAVDPETEESHGLAMAQIVSGLLSHTPGISYELHLYSAYGYSNLEAAIHDVVAEKFDLVLYSQVWEYGGNGDGAGFINALVNQATAAGVIWINASGNFGDATYLSSVTSADDGWAHLPSANNGVQVRCHATKVDKGTCHLRAVLSWNDFKDDVNVGTDKDLDLILSDDALKIVETSALEQVKSDAGPGQSLYPREIIEADLKSGLYLLRVKIRSTNFSSDQDHLKITVSGDGVEMLHPSSPSETLLNPADNSSVITVGASDSPKSGRSASLSKPELLTDSAIHLENGDTYKGSSNSAAITAAAVAVLKAERPDLDRAGVLARLGSSSSGLGGAYAGAPGQGLPLAVLGFAPTGPGCFMTAILPVRYPTVQRLLDAGAFSVATTAGIKIFTELDPISLFANLVRRNPNDMIVINSVGATIMPRLWQGRLGTAAYEVVQQPSGTQVCGFGTSQASSPATGQLRLPTP